MYKQQSIFEYLSSQHRECGEHTHKGVKVIINTAIFSTFKLLLLIKLYHFGVLTAWNYKTLVNTGIKS